MICVRQTFVLTAFHLYLGLQLRALDVVTVFLILQQGCLNTMSFVVDGSRFCLAIICYLFVLDGSHPYLYWIKYSSYHQVVVSQCHAYMCISISKLKGAMFCRSTENYPSHFRKSLIL